MTKEANWRDVCHSKSIIILKRAFDISCSVLFFVMFGWLYLLLWIGVRITSGSPAIYSQPRYGKDGRIFKFYKFRSMVPNADVVLEEHLKSDPAALRQWQEFQKLENDIRITPFGRLIRKTSLDELPQFWNVLIGDMSLIGPRPCMTGQKDLYGKFWPYYCMVRPGITGLWQVSGRNKLSFERRVELDVQYVKNFSIRAEVRIAIKTLMVVVTGYGSR